MDNKTQLDLNDDAARANWEGSWRMPTDAEWTELRNQCTWKWTTQNGVKGYKVKSKNGNFIFFPLAGYRSGSSLNSAGSTGCYWSSSLYLGARNEAWNSGGPQAAWGVDFSFSSVDRNYCSRYYGQSVRPVCP